MAKQLNVSLSFNADTAKAKAQIQDLQHTLDQLVKGSAATAASKGSLGITKELMEAQVAATKLQTILNQSVNQNTGNLDLTKFSESFNKAGMNLKTLRGQLDSLGPTGQKAFMSLASSIVSADVPLKRTNALVTELWTTMKNTARWQLSSSVLHSFMGTIQSATSYAKDLDESLNNIRIVTGQSAEQMAAFADRANKAAKALSTTTTEYTNASLIYYQQGLSDSEVQDRADITIKMAHASGQSAEIVSDQLTAVWNNFYDGSKSLEHYADVMTALGAATASSSDEIAGGLEKFASIADMIGLSYEYAASALATITATTRQSEDVVGTALKTIFARIQGLSLGETLEDGTNLNKYSEALQKVGISIFEQNGELKDMDNILNEMGDKWETLSKDQQVALAQTVAGVRQYNQLVSLMDNWDFFESNLDIANNSEGALQEQADIYAESWKAARDRVRAAAQDIYDSILDPDFFIGILDGFEKVLSMVAHFTDSIGGLKGVFAGLGVVVTKVFSAQLAESVERLAFNLRSMTGETQKAAAELQELAVSEVNKMQFNTGTQAGDMEATALRRQLQLQNEIRNVAQNLSQEQREQLSDLLKINEAYAEQAIRAAQAKDAASDKVQNTASSLRGIVKRGSAIDDDGNQLDIDQKIAQFSQAQRNLRAELQQGLKASDQFKWLTTSINDTSKSTEAARRQIAQLLEHLNNIGRSKAAEKINELTYQFQDGRISAEQYKKALLEITTAEEIVEDTVLAGADAFKESLSQYNLTQQQCDQLANEMMELVSSERNASDAARAASKAHVELKASILGFNNAMQGFGQSVVKGMQGISQISMGLMSLKGIWDTLNNEDLTFGEKLLQVTMSLSMAIPSLIGGIQTLKAAKLGEAAATVKSAVAKALDSIAAISNAGANAGATAASSALTGSLWGQVAAWLAVHTAMSPVMILLVSILGPILAVVAAAALLVGIGTAIYNEYHKAAITLDRANETLKETENAFNNATTAAESFKNEVSSYEEVANKLKDTTLSTEELAAASEEASKKAKDLIETYGLFDEKYRTVDRFGNVQLSEEGLEQLGNIQTEKNATANRTESLNYLSKIHQTNASLNNDATNIGRSISYTQHSEHGTVAYTATNKEVESLGRAINSVRSSMDGITPSADELKKQILESADKFGLSQNVLNHLDDYINNETIDSLTKFATSLTESQTAIDYFNQKLLGQATEDAYGDVINDIADDENQAELMNEVLAQALARGDAKLGEVQSGYLDSMSKDVLAKVTTYDAGNQTESNVNELLDEIFAGVEGFDAETYLKDHYSEIFAGTSQSYDGNINAQEMAQAYFESQGIDVTSVKDKSGYTKLSGTTADGGDWDQDIDNEIAQSAWAEQVAQYAIQDRMSQLSKEQMSEEDVENMFSGLKANSQQFGTDFTNNLLAGFANAKDGEAPDFDFSSLFGDLSQGEVDQIKGLESADIATLFGFDETELESLGGISAEQFGEAFKKGLEDYSSKDFYEQEAAELDMSAEAFEGYVKSLQKSNERLAENEDLAVSVAKAQIKLNREIEEASETFAKNDKILQKSNEGTEEFAQACGDVAGTLNDVFGDGAFDAEFVADNLDLVKSALEGNVDSLASLQDMAAERLMIDAGVDVDTEGAGKELNDWIGSQQFHELEIGTSLDDSGMTAAFQALLDSGAMTVDQMNELLSGIGYEPDIKMVDVVVQDNTASGQTATVKGTIPRLTEDGEVVEEPFSTSIVASGNLKAGETIQIPYIQGKGTTKVSAPKTMSKAAANGSGGGGGGGGGKSSPAKPVKYTKKSDVIDRYKEQDDALDDIEEALKDINKQKDRAYGISRIRQMDNEQKMLLKQKEALEGKAKAAKDFLDSDKEALKQAAQKHGLNFEFDELGNIVNYTTEMTKLYDQLHAEEEKMDKMSTKEAQDEFKEATIAPIEDKIEEIKDLIAQYDDTKELLEDLENEIDEAFYAWQDSNYEELTYKLELKIEIDDAKLKRLDYFINKFSDDFYRMSETVEKMVAKAPNFEHILNTYISDDRMSGHIADLKNAYAAGEISQEAYLEGLKESRDAIYEQLENLIALDKEMLHFYEDTLGAASDELDDYTDHMEHLNGVFDHYINLSEILGKQKDWGMMGDFLTGKASVTRDQLDVAKEYYQVMLDQEEDIKKQLDNAKRSGSEEDVRYWQEQWDAIVDATDEAQEQVLSLTEEWAESMKAIFENDLASAFDALEKSLTDNKGFEKLLDDFDKLNLRQEEFLTKTNQIYETNKLMRTANKALDETDNKVAKQKLKNFIDETKGLQETTQLSQYELEIQQAKYDLLLAEIALEEAQNAKATVRLSRDNEGNFGYVYTADQDAVDDAQQGLEDAENNLYNISLEGQQNYTEKYLQAHQQMLDEMKAVTDAYAEGEITSKEEVERRLADIQEHYYGVPNGILTTYSNLYNVAVRTDANATADYWGKEYGEMTQHTEDWKDKVTICIADINTATADWEKVSEQANKDVADALDNSADKTKDLTDESENLKNMINDEVIPAIEDELEAVAEQVIAYGEARDAILEMIAAYEEYLALLDQEIEAAAGVTYDKNTDYTAVMSGYLAAGGKKTDSQYRALEAQREAKIVGENLDKEYYGSKVGDPEYNVQADDTWYKNKDEVNEKLKQLGISTFASGGYSGDWGPEGKLAILHEKELVLNKDDTDNLLRTVSFIREIISSIDSQASMAGLFNMTASRAIDTRNSLLEQSVTIHAEFPNATNHNEIEEAFNNLVNRAAQYANRK